MPFRVVLLVLVLALCGCGDDDAPGAGSDSGLPPDGGASADALPDAGPCVTPTPGMVIRASTTLCGGTFALAAAEGTAAISIEADGVTLACAGTVLDGEGSLGTVMDPAIGIAIRSHADVSVVGCTVRGYRYGVAAYDASNVTIEGAHLDDNFTDPMADWVQDSVQGGGIRLDGVTGGRVASSSFARTWNGIELRDTRGVVVEDNVADHCSNTGATLVDAHDNELRGNDFSWGIRGPGLSFPDAWYGIDTKDSAGIIVDAGSSGNRIVDNDVRYGGDGIFIRSVIGGCAEDNHVEGNDTSFSPHNAIECWCDGNAFIGNIASDSHYGLWLGGTDRGVVRGNTVERSVVDGMSIQIGEDRHTIIEDNVVTDSGRAGILLTGREYQAWHGLDYWSPNLASSSHIVVQRNELARNARVDLFVTSTRSLLLASNCGTGGGAPIVDAPREVELLVTTGTCGGAEGRTAPTAVLADPGAVVAGTPVRLDASGSTPGTPGETLRQMWLVQPAATRFASGVLPPALLAREGASTEMVTFTPGVWDVGVTVHDGALGAIAYRQVAVSPAGRRVGETAAEWMGFCASTDTCMTAITDDAGGVDGTQVHVATDAPFDFTLTTPPTHDLGLASAGLRAIALFVRARNENTGGWQGNFPVIVLGSASGSARYEPASNLLPTSASEWLYIEIPLEGGSGWTRTGTVPDAIDWIELHTDTWDYGTVDLWLDAVTLL